MDTQLVKRYLAKTDCRHGLYLVGWFVCDLWSRKDSRRKNLKFKNLETIRDYLSQQASQMSKDGTQVRAIVLDISLPSLRKGVAGKSAKATQPTSKRPPSR
jgi:hypothetical protein